MDSHAARDATTQNSSTDDPIRWLAERLRWEQDHADLYAVWAAGHPATPQRHHPDDAAPADHHTAPGDDLAAATGPNHETEPTMMMNEDANCRLRRRPRLGGGAGRHGGLDFG